MSDPLALNGFSENAPTRLWWQGTKIYKNQPDRTVRAASPIQRDVFALGEFQEAVMAAFAAQPALLDAAKGRGGIGNQPAIEPNHAGFQPLADGQPALEIAGIKIGG